MTRGKKGDNVISKNKVITLCSFCSLFILLSYSSYAFALSLGINYVPRRDEWIRITATFPNNRPPEQLLQTDIEGAERFVFPRVAFPPDKPIPEDATDLHVRHSTTKAGLDTAPDTTYGVITAETGGGFHLSNLAEGLFNLIGSNEALTPYLSNQAIPLFIGIDLTQWLAKPTPFNEGDVFTFVNGLSTSLPGFIVSTSNISFSPVVGWVTTSPFTGSAEVDGTLGITAIPEPASIILLFTGLVWLYRGRNERF
jgi:hypothetical protein